MAKKPFTVRTAPADTPALTLIFGQPKIGKTTFVGQLPKEDTLIIDTERGARFIDGTVEEGNNYIQYVNVLDKVQTEVWRACKEWLIANPDKYYNPAFPTFAQQLVNLDPTVENIEKLPADLNEAKSIRHITKAAFRWVMDYLQKTDTKAYYELFPYKFIVIDTITNVEGAANTKALADYSKTVQGKGALDKVPDATNILDLNIDTKWLKSRDACIDLMVNRLLECCPHGILIGHVRDKYVGQEGVDMKKEKTLALTGQLSNLVMSKVDLIGFLEAKPDKITKEVKRKLNFLSGKESKTMGSRIPRLDGQIIDLDWSIIFPFLTKSN